MPELLLEVGCEELPATFVRKAYTDLHVRIATVLGEFYGSPFQGTALGTPRRLIVSFPEIPSRQPDATKEVRGPALKAAYDAAGNPAPALLGFCRSNGVEPGQLRRDEQYVWLTKAVVGLATAELLAEALPKAIKGLTFDKSMRWGSGRLRFARPIRWILAAFDNAAVDFEIEGVKSGLDSRGHRFYAPEAFPASNLTDLVAKLRERKVEPDVDRRAATIRAQAAEVAEGTPDLPEDLVAENAFLAEWPTAIEGIFRSEHLNLPSTVLTTAMAKHEKMFPVRDVQGALLNRFVFIRNSGEDDATRRGAEWVLNARLDDAQFFFKEDAKHDLDYFLEKTSGIVFQEKLGTVRERADRLEMLASYIAEQAGGDKEAVSDARKAGKYAKADLSTGLVTDMASLQGIVGGEYGLRQNFPESVCRAISAQYDYAKILEPGVDGAFTSLCLSLADNLDKLVGFIGLGLIPTGSSDPFGLRRAATALIEIAFAWQAAPDYARAVEHAARLYSVGSHEIAQVNLAQPLEDLFVSRYQVLLPEARYDVLEAAWRTEDSHVLRPRVIRTRTQALTLLAGDTKLIATAVRAANIVSAAVKKKETFQEPNESGADLAGATTKGIELHAKALEAGRSIESLIAADDSAGAAKLSKSLEEPVNSFMDSTMIMSDDASERFARLTVLRAVAWAFGRIGDFTKLVIEG